MVAAVAPAATSGTVVAPWTSIADTVRERWAMGLRSETTTAAAVVEVASIHALASQLAAPEVELTPVQVLFELVDRYSAELVLGDDIYSGLKEGLAPVVFCKRYGASIERNDLNRVVERVLGLAAG